MSELHHLGPTKVVLHEQHQASIATNATPSPDLSTITHALSSLTHDDLLRLQTNITDLLPPPKDTEDFNKKLAALPTLPEVDLIEDLSLGSLANKDNITKDTFENYSQSFKPFSPNIPFSVIAKRNSPPSITTGSLRSLTMDHLSKFKTLGKISTPQAISFNVPTSSNFTNQDVYLSSMATTNPFSLLSDTEDDDPHQAKTTSPISAKPTANTTFTDTTTPTLIPVSYHEQPPSTDTINKTSNASTRPISNKTPPPSSKKTKKDKKIHKNYPLFHPNQH